MSKKNINQFTKLSEEELKEYKWAVDYVNDIISTLETEFIPYAGQILLNNLPSIDGVLPVHRKVLWALHKNGVTFDKNFIKMLRASAYSMVYYVLGDLPLTKAMKNMANNGLNYFYLEPYGSFGDKRKKKGVGASPRYIECKLSLYGQDMLKGVNKNSVPYKRNFDNTEDEITILPSVIPNILSNTSQSIAVGEASKIPGHNINDLCNSIQIYIIEKNIEKAIKILKCPDLSTYGRILYDEKTFKKIYEEGRGSFTLIGNYRYNEIENIFSIVEVPYETYIETIEEKLRECYDKGLFKEITDIRNISGKQGIQLDIDLKKNTNVNAFEKKLRKLTPYECKFSCNFTIIDLDGKTPKLMNLQKIYDTWTQHRINCIKNETQFDIDKNKEELNRLYGLKAINDDLDKAIQIIRSSKTEKVAAENLTNHFNLNQKQAEYISTIRLLNINQEWINNKIINISKLEEENAKLINYYKSEEFIKETIISQLEDVKKKYGKPRMTEILYEDNTQDITKEDLIEDHTVTLCLSKEGYIKRNLKYSESQKLKEGDEILQLYQTTNKTDLLLFTNQGRLFTRKTYDIEEKTPSQIGEYLPNIIELQANEKVIYICTTKDYKEDILFVFQNGNIAKTKLSAYKTKNNRQVAQTAYNTENKLVGIGIAEKDCDVFMISSEGKGTIIDSSRLISKGKNIQGNSCIKLEDNYNVVKAIINPKQDLWFNIVTEKGKNKEFRLDDIANCQGGKSWYEYLRGAGTLTRTGNFILNCKNNNDKIINVVLNE